MFDLGNYSFAAVAARQAKMWEPAATFARGMEPSTSMAKLLESSTSMAKLLESSSVWERGLPALNMMESVGRASTLGLASNSLGLLAEVPFLKKSGFAAFDDGRVGRLANAKGAFGKQSPDREAMGLFETRSKCDRQREAMRLATLSDTDRARARQSEETELLGLPRRTFEREPRTDFLDRFDRRTFDLVDVLNRKTSTERKHRAIVDETAEVFNLVVEAAEWQHAQRGPATDGQPHACTYCDQQYHPTDVESATANGSPELECELVLLCRDCQRKPPDVLARLIVSAIERQQQGRHIPRLVRPRRRPYLYLIHGGLK